MNTNMLKVVVLLSVIVGLISGFLTIIPYVGAVVFWIVMCFTSVLVMLYLHSLRVLNLQSVNESAVMGFASGFTSFIGFSISYIPCAIILAKFFNLYPNYGVSLMLNNATFGVMVMFVIFIAVLSATVNAFFGFLTYYGINYLDGIKK